jgi:hypothetical protein
MAKIPSQTCSAIFPKNLQKSPLKRPKDETVSPWRDKQIFFFCSPFLSFVSFRAAAPFATLHFHISALSRPVSASNGYKREDFVVTLPSFLPEAFGAIHGIALAFEIECHAGSKKGRRVY